MNERALIVSYYFPPMNGPVTQHPSWFMRFLPFYGIDGYVVASSVFFGENLGAPLLDGNVHSVPYGKFAQRFARRLYQAEFVIQGKFGVWEHGFAWAAAFGIAEASRLIRSGGFKTVISASPSVASHWAAYKIKQRFPSLKWIAFFADPFFGNPLRTSRPWLAPFEGRLERAIFSTADYLGANTKPARDLWRDRYPEFADKFVVIPNGYDPEEQIMARPLPEQRAPVLAHVGAVYGGRIPDALFEALFELTQAGHLRPGQVVIEFLGSSDFSSVRRPDQFDHLCRTGVVRVRNEYVPRKEALRFIEEAGYLLLVDVTGQQNARLQVPSKLFDYVRVGRPVLAFTVGNSPTARILEHSGIEHVIIPTDASAGEVQAGILRFLALPRHPRPPSPWFSRYFDARNIVAPLAALIEGERPEDIPLW